VLRIAQPRRIYDMTATYRMVVQLSALLGLAVAAGAADDKLAATLKGVVEENLRAYDAEDAAGVLRSMHTRSPEYDPTRGALPEQFQELDAKAKLVDFRYMGHDDEFAAARVKIKVEGPPGSVFVNNTIDNIVLFHQEGGIWKLWSDEVLGVDFEQRIGTLAPPR
jgi:hypothetical protein